jgi:hypothetical protein
MSGVTERYFTQVGSGSTRKLETPARNERSNLIQTSVNYSRKKFYNIGSRCQRYKHFFSFLKDALKE